MAKVLAVISGKGRVGKTTAAINLGLALNNFGRRVVVVDGDILKPNVGTALGLSHTGLSSHSLHAAVKEGRGLDQVVYLHSSGLNVIAGDSSLFPNPVIIAKQVFESIKGSELAILDSPSGFGQDMENTLSVADAAIIVFVPDAVAVHDGLRTLRLAHKHSLKLLGFILNRFKQGQSEFTPGDIEKITSLKCLAVIPDTQLVSEAAKLKQPACHLHPNSGFSEGFKALAAGILGQEYVGSIEKHEQEGLFMQLLRKLGLKNG
jgi:septum site-determining protein MinD